MPNPAPHTAPSLFDPIQLGDIRAPNRILMSPLTRGRSTDAHVPTPVMIDYYCQRATAGLIISEGTGISQEGLGWPKAPGLWTEEQVEAWKPVTAAVHKAGGRIVTQLWHMGRLSRPEVIGMQPLSASAILAPYHRDPNPYGEPKAATLDDLSRVLDDFSTAARNALRAGFDGVQLHAANGYLIDQFLRNGTNEREDEYGGSPENRMRLLGEVVDRLIAEWGVGRTGVRLSPNGDSQGADDSDPHAIFVPAAAMLQAKNIAYLEMREQNPTSTFGPSDVPKLSPQIRQVFTNPLILNQDYDRESAQADLDSGLADAIAFGRPFIANPDLVERLRHDAPLNQPDTKTFYTAGPEGYVDYPALVTEPA